MNNNKNNSNQPINGIKYNLSCPYYQRKKFSEIKNLEIKIPISLILSGKNNHQIEYNEKNYFIDIQPGDLEGTKYEVENMIFTLKYEEDNYYKRKENDLIGIFNFKKEDEGKQTQIPYPIPNILNSKFIIQRGTLIMKGYGFTDKDNSFMKGNYIIKINLI